MILAVVGIGLLIGASLGAVGGGGSVLTVPALVFVLGVPVHRATGISLVIVGASALFGVLTCARQGNVRWGAGLAFCALGVGTSYAGQVAGRSLDQRVLLAGFALVLVAAGTAMLLRARSARAAAHGESSEDHVGVSGGTGRGLLVRVVVLAALVGFLTGFFGVGGGFLIVPVLVISLGYPMAEAVGTSLWIIALNSAVALVLRAGQESFDLHLTSELVAAGVVGTLVGRRIADRCSARVLERVFAGFVITVAVYVGLRSAT